MKLGLEDKIEFVDYLEGFMDRHKEDYWSNLVQIKKFVEMLDAGLDLEKFINAYNTLGRKVFLGIRRGLREGREVGSVLTDMHVEEFYKGFFENSRKKSDTGQADIKENKILRFPSRASKGLKGKVLPLLFIVSSLFPRIARNSEINNIDYGRNVAVKGVQDSALKRKLSLSEKLGVVVDEINEDSYVLFMETFDKIENLNLLPYRDDKGKNPSPEEFISWIKDASRAYKVPESLLFGVIMNEVGVGYNKGKPDIRPYFNGKPRVSPSGAVGVCQAIKRWHPELDYERLKEDSRYGVFAAAKILKEMRTYTGNWKRAVFSYHSPEKRFREQSENYLRRAERHAWMWKHKINKE